MGAWGISTFENDDACDWLYDLENSSDLTVIKNALSLDDYIDAPDGCMALAASEVVAAMMGHMREGFPESALKWVNDNKALELRTLKLQALDAVNKVLSEKSELLELWKDTEDFDDWKRDVEEIRKMLSST